MFKLPFFGKKEKFPNQFFALDLGGKRLKVFLFQDVDGAVRPLGSRKVPRGENQAEDLKEAVADLRQDFADASSTAVVGISGPEHLAFTTVVRSGLSRDVEELVSHARSAARRSAEEELRHSFGEPKLAVSELEAEILEVKEVEKLEVYLFTSFASAPFLAEQAELARHAGLSLWGFTSLPFNLVSELSGGEAASGVELNVLIFDVGGSKTEISLVFGGQLIETKSFFWEFNENVDPTIFLDLWLFSVGKALKTFEGVEAFPAKIFLAGAAAGFPGLAERVASYPWSQEHPFEVAPEVATLEEDRLPLSLGQVALRLKEESERSISQ